MIIPLGITHIAKRLTEIMKKSDLLGNFRGLLQRLFDHLKTLDKQVDDNMSFASQFYKILRQVPPK